MNSIGSIDYSGIIVPTFGTLSDEKIDWKVSEAAITYVATNLADVLECMLQHQQLVSEAITFLRDLSATSNRLRAVDKYFGYCTPRSESALIPLKNNNFTNVKWSFVPFLQNLAHFLSLPEVQVDMECSAISHNRVMFDVHDGTFETSHGVFKDRNFLKFELNAGEVSFIFFLSVTHTVLF
ncbi:unnamed protein product [Didymodactylos carnosus]|uniref:Uncharacterized protein n=1 Tax=Didymodactylos carnosus TaxID=1234261 RepID=A0A8S2ER13_9BILA|nr:unnamed protein product [Didymodactylos carnosus]CAF4022663.1 unnamed protein product [Didymodactylos carnosus]